ncbi:MAG: MBL fold metallo-hydrolase [Eubacteriales bacterium]|nr:MBL fold metallo-hydrolase [Eubacteriales bacterium]MDD3882012.1 MBL fold metallo-hydrolase [Eubacteriales bacterium]MDD4513710.1 MBL fold metallo-hydrolase [Eubacteriales bacterium]
MDNIKSGKELLDEALSASVGHGGVCFWWLGQLGYLVRAGGVTILIDAYLSRGHSRLHEPLFEPEELHGIDYIFGSHDHLDHIDSVAWKVMAQKMPDAKFILPSALAQAVSERLQIPRSRFYGVNDGTLSYSDDNIKVTAIASAHESLDRDDVSGEYLYTGFVIECGGVRLYHSGDNVVYEGLITKLLALMPIDIMFFPINGRDARRYRMGLIGNMTYQEAVDMVLAVKPALAVPGHYDMFASNSADPADFTDYMSAKAPRQAVWVGSRGEKVEYSNAK